MADTPADSEQGPDGMPGQEGEQLDAAHRAQSSYQRPVDWVAPGAALVSSAATEQIPAIEDLGRVHIMGIAGAGMSGLARIMLARGLQVSGCEGRDSVTVTALRALGADVSIGHSLQHLDQADTLVYTTAINPSHFELNGARERGLRVLRRASALAATITGKRPVAIAGTHGKTTTTSLLTIAAQAGGLDPSFAIGGNLYESGLNAHAGSGDVFVVEADESDGSFLLLRPAVAVVTNVEADHLENHGDLEGIFRAFELFLDRIEPGGLLVVCADDAGSRRLTDYARTLPIRVQTYGVSVDADIQVSDIVEQADGVAFTVGIAGESYGLRVGSLLGAHMALNATAAFAVSRELGVDPEAVSAAWSSFQGVRRRFEFRGAAREVRVYDDYAHHPTEVRAALTAARSVLTGKSKLIAVFQPGTYSRTQTFAAEFGQAMAVADIAIVMDVFPAREEPIPGVTGALIADQVALPPAQVIYEPSWSAMAGRVADVAEPGDVVVTMGIGDVYLACPEILLEIAARP
jgi:UDP-N-acetylmuramate--alanine ligase